MPNSQITNILRKNFGFDKFKSKLQEEAIKEISERVHDVLISLPTGFGKSLCYQLPAVLHFTKVTIVFSPLLALIKDQIDRLTSLKIKAVSLNSKTLTAERTAILTDLKTASPNIRLLYITPEQAATNTFKELFKYLIKHNRVAYIVVDEAHCISEWGHDFRPDYLKLGELRNNHEIPIIALTATAGSEVTKDIIISLKLKDSYKTFKTSSFRKNLFYDVYYQNLLDSPFEHLKTFILSCLNTQEESVTKENKPCGIIYCRTRDQTETLANRLNELGIRAVCYHAGLKQKERLEFQEGWQRGEYPTICATISFGMGIDKATVRFVVHWGVPKDPASFYQESGRAGRDGRASKCRIYYNRVDRKAIEFHLSHDLAKAKDKENKKRKAENAIKAFTKIIEFCETAKECRHRLFSNYFGEAPPECKNRCDICRNKKEVEERVRNFLMRCIQFSDISNSTKFHGDVLYENGREGTRRESAEYDSDSNSGLEREQRAREQSNELIRKQFALRRHSHEGIQQTIDQLHTKRHKVKAASCTANKVSGLTLVTREQYHSKITELLSENYICCCLEQRIDKKDLEDCAADLEYSIFSSTTTYTMYRSSGAKLVANIKKNTMDNKLFDVLVNLKSKPAQHSTLGDLFRNIKKEQMLNNINKLSPSSNEAFQAAGSSKRKFQVFQTAKEVFESKNQNVHIEQTSLESFFQSNRRKDYINREQADDENISLSDKSLKINHDLGTLFVEETNSEICLEVNKNEKIISNATDSQLLNKSCNVASLLKQTSKNDLHQLKLALNHPKHDGKSFEITNVNKNCVDHKKTNESLGYAVPCISQGFKRISSSKRKLNIGEDTKSKVKKQAIVVEKDLETKSKGTSSTKRLEKSQKTKKVQPDDCKSLKDHCIPKLKKTEIGLLVVKLLTPAYAQKRFDSKDTFKSTARNISHALLYKGEDEIKKFVKFFLKNNEKITSETTV